MNSHDDVCSATLGLLLLVGLLFIYFRKTLPVTVPQKATGMSLPSDHPMNKFSIGKSGKDRTRFMRNVLLFLQFVQASSLLPS